MKTHNLKLHSLAAVMACAAVFYTGCGDDDDNATPSNTGGKSSGTGGTASDTGGSKATGGTETSTGGKSTGGVGNNAGAGGEPIVEGGAGGGGGSGATGAAAGSGGDGGGGGTADGLPPCSNATYVVASKCYDECDPVGSATSEQFLNHCSSTRANCTPFNNATLTKLGANGALPPIP